VSLAGIRTLLASVSPYVCVIVDEAYCEFSVLEDPDASIDLLREHPNLALLRTFSKVHGLAALRVGFALCGSEELRIALDQVRQPFFCNVAAQAAATEALRHTDAVTRRVESTLAARLALEDALRDLGLAAARSEANFLWVALGEERDEAELVRGLADRRVLVRAGAALGREGHLRVTVGTPDDNDRFVAALEDLL
jgi:histidinol-phosphate aminotransferase